MSGADQTRLKSTLKLGSMSQRLGAPVQHLPHFIRPPCSHSWFDVTTTGRPCPAPAALRLVSRAACRPAIGPLAAGTRRCARA